MRRSTILLVAICLISWLGFADNTPAEKPKPYSPPVGNLSPTMTRISGDAAHVVPPAVSARSPVPSAATMSVAAAGDTVRHSVNSNPLQEELNGLVAQRKNLEMRGENLKVIDGRIAAVLQQIRSPREPGNPLDQGADNCPATEIPSVPYTDTGTTIGLNNDYAPSCASSAAPDVVYRFYNTYTGTYTISLCGSDFDTILELRTGPGCPGTTVVSCNDDYCGLQSQITAYGIPEGEYFIIVDGYGGNSGNYTLSISGPPPPLPDQCPGITISALPFSDTRETTFDGNQYSPECGYSVARDAIYNFTPSVSGTHTVSLCGSFFDTILDVRYGGSCPGSTSIVCNDDYCGAASEVTPYLNAGTTYYILVDGYGAASGTYTLNVSRQAAPGDNCSNPGSWSVPFSGSYNTCFFVNDYDYACPWTSSSPDEVLAYTPTVNQVVSVGLCRSEYDTKLLIYDNSCSGTPVACSDDAANCPCAVGPFRSLVECLQLYAGHTYYAVIDGYGGSCGLFVMDAALCPSCDITAQPGDVVEIAENCADYNFFTTDPDGGCNVTPPQYASVQNGQTVFGRVFTNAWASPSRDTDWYLFTLTQPSIISVSAEAECGLIAGIADPGNCSLLSYMDRPSGCSGTGTYQTTCMNPGTYALFVAPPESYFYDLPFPRDYRAGISWVPCAPANDNCANAIPLSVNGPPVNGTTIGATEDCSGAFGLEVWYTFTIPQCSEVRANLCGFTASPIAQPLYYTSCCHPSHFYSSGFAYFEPCAEDYTSMVWYGVPAGTYWLPIGFVGPTNFTLHLTTVAGPPANDQCANAELLASLPANRVGSTVCATVDNVSPCPSSPSAPGVWYRVMGTGDSITASTCGSWYDTKLSVYRGVCPELICVAENPGDPSCSWSQTAKVSWCSRPGVMYSILIHGDGGAADVYILDVTDSGTPCPPPNDDCANAILLTVNSPTPTCGTTLGATPDCGWQSTMVWYSFAIDQWSDVSVHLCGSTVPVDCYYLFLGPCCAGNSYYADHCLDQTCGDGFPIRTFVNMPPGNYTLPVQAVQNPGAFCVRVTTVPAVAENDACEGAIIIPLFQTVCGTTRHATLDNLPACAAPATSPGVWYKVIGTGNSLSAMTCGSLYQLDTRVAVFGCGCSGMMCIAEDDYDMTCNYDPMQARATWCSVAGAEYLILVHGQDTEIGDFMLRVEDYGSCTNPLACPPPNDDCANAIPITVNDPNPTCGSVSGATLDCIQNCPPNVWYTFTLTECQEVSVQLCGTPASGAVCLPLYSGSCCGTLHDIVNQDITTCPDGNVTSYYGGLFPGQYWLSVAIGPDPMTDYCVRVTGSPGPPDNDVCESAQLLGLSETVYASTVCATADVVPDCPAGPTNAGVWYRVVGTGNTITATTCDPFLVGFDTRLSVFTCGCINLSCVSGNNDDQTCIQNLLASRVSWCSMAGEEYLILVHGEGGQVGNFKLTISDDGVPCNTPVACPPPNDNCVNAIPLEVNASTPACGTTVGATADCGWTDYSAVWYTFTLSECQEISVEYCGSSDFVSVMSILTGGSCCGTGYGWTGSLDTLTCSDGRRTIHYGGLPAGQYWVPVYIQPAGAFCIRIIGTPGPPPNDQCTNASPIAVNGASAFGSTRCATLDNVPPCTNPVTSPGIWYSVFGTGHTLYAFTCDPVTQFDTRLSIFACDCSDPTCVTSSFNSPPCAPWPHGSLASWCSVPGETYRILVSGVGTQRGNFRLTVTDSGQVCSTTPPCCPGPTLNAPGSISGTTVGMGNECSTWPGQDVVVSVTIPTPGSWSFSLCGSDPALFPYVGTTCCQGGIRNGDWVTCASGQIGAVAWCADIGQAGTYYCTIDDTIPGAGGAYTLTVFEDVPPGQVTGVSASDNLCNGINITWNDLPDENYYYIYRDTIEVTRVNANTTSFLDNTTGTHNYRVLSSTWCYIGPFSLPDQGTRLTPPSPVVLLSPPNGAQIYSGAQQLWDWEPVANATDYRIQWDDDPAFSSPMEAMTGGDTQITFALTAPLGTWTWRVRAENLCGWSPWTTGWIDLAEVPAPTVVCYVSSGEVRLSWNPVPGASYYIVMQADSPGGPWYLLMLTDQTTITVPSGSGRKFYYVAAVF